MERLTGRKIIMKYDIKTLAQIVSQIDLIVREKLKDQPVKLWEHTFIFNQIQNRRNGKIFTIEDHIRAMVYSFLTAGIPWDSVSGMIDADTGRLPIIDKVFCDYDPDFLLGSDPEILSQEIRKKGIKPRFLTDQMEALIKTNITKLIEWDNHYHSIDKYYERYIIDKGDLRHLVFQLCDKGSKDKLAGLGVGLTAEYLKNVGYSDAVKPDVHLCRIFGRDRLACSDCKNASEYEVFRIVYEITEEMNKVREITPAEVEYILWTYCADGYGEYCIAEPKTEDCLACPAKRICKLNNK